MTDSTKLKEDFEKYSIRCFDIWQEENPRPRKLKWNPFREFANYKKWHTKWQAAVRPLAEQWWRERGYQIIFQEGQGDDYKVVPLK